MEVLKRITVPTGDILIVEGEKGKLECLSLGDYGKDVNIKCDALGLDREPETVRHTKLLPLEEKWVITISTQYGCSMGCKFCDVPKVGPGVNATEWDLAEQVRCGLDLHPEVTASNRLNIHFARMGEPTWNPNVLKAARLFKEHLNNFNVHPVVSTMMPRKNRFLETFIKEWMHIKNEIYNGEAGLQLSINSTDQDERNKMFNYNAMNFASIHRIMEPYHSPRGRKITLNFAVADYTIDPLVLRKYFDINDYIIKLTPMHRTKTALDNGIQTTGEVTTYYPYKEIEQSLKAVGYDVLVFIASDEEDMSRITCGNAILSGTMPETPYTIK